MLGNIQAHRLGHLIAHRAIGSKAAAQLAARDIEARAIDEHAATDKRGDGRREGRQIHTVAGASNDDEAHKADEIGDAVPAGQITSGVGANDEPQLGVSAIAVVVGLNGVDRIRGWGAGRFSFSKDRRQRN